MKLKSSVAVAALTLVSGMAFAVDKPTLNITSPTAAGGVLYLGGFPATVPVSYTAAVSGSTQSGATAVLKDLNNLNVTVNGVSLYGTTVGLNAFDNASLCTGAAATSPNTCSTSSVVS